ncbi:MAG: amidohydrolase family protein [Flavisolibacter sp.]
MAYRKFKAHKIFDGYKLLDDHVLITTQEGIIESVLPETEAGDDIELMKGVLSPGFINCHCHLELSHMKGLIPEQTGLVDFVFKVVTERQFSESDILIAIANAEEEMIQNGIVGVGDICNNTFTIPQKQKNRIAYYNFIEASGWLPSVAATRFERAKNFYESFELRALSFEQNTRSSKLTSRSSIVPHAPYSVSQPLWELIQPYFENKVVSIHNQETAYEDEFFLHGTGDFERMYHLMKIDNTHHQPTKRSSLQSYFDKLEKASSIILVHNTFISQVDLHYVKKSTSHKSSNTKRIASNYSLHASRNESPILGHQPQTPNPQLQTFFCLCPNANLYIENVLPPVELLRKNDCTIVLGTDSLASNWSLDILAEIKTIRKKFPLIPIEECLQWATINGAMALEMQDVLGSFEKGKKPGVNLIGEDLNTVKNLI